MPPFRNINSRDIKNVLDNLKNTNPNHQRIYLNPIDYNWLQCTSNVHYSKVFLAHLKGTKSFGSKIMRIPYRRSKSKKLEIQSIIQIECSFIMGKKCFLYKKHIQFKEDFVYSQIPQKWRNHNYLGMPFVITISNCQ